MPSTVLASAGTALVVAAVLVTTIRVRTRHQSGVSARVRRSLSRVRPLPGPLDVLERELEGSLFLPLRDPEAYMVARFGGSLNGRSWVATWNLDALGLPSAIVSVKSIKDVQTVLRYASTYLQGEHNGQRTKLCVAGGRHSHLCMLDDALVLDLCWLQGIEVDQASQTLTCMPGTSIGQVGRALAPLGLAFPTGHSPTTGIPGMTVQGGISYLSRSFGLAVDWLESAQVVTPDGSLWVASAHQNPDLFWALRGGGGNFGVVVQLTFRLFKLPRTVIGGLRTYFPSGAIAMACGSRCDVILQFVDMMSRDDEAAAAAAATCFNTGSTDKPPRFRASGMLVLTSRGPVYEVLVYCGIKQDADAWLQRRDNNNNNNNNNNKISKAVAWIDGLGVTDYHQHIQELTTAKPGNKFMSGLLLDAITPETARVLSGLVSQSAPSGCSISVVPMGGEIAAVAPEATAFFHRKAAFWVVLNGNWGSGDEGQRSRRAVQAWVQLCKSKLNKYMVGHYAVLDRPDILDATSPVDYGAVGAWLTVRNVFGSNLARLRNIKHKFDPHNVMCTNDNVLPVAAEPAVTTQELL